MSSNNSNSSWFDPKTVKKMQESSESINNGSQVIQNIGTILGAVGAVIGIIAGFSNSNNGN